MSTYESKPWLRLYNSDQPATIVPEHHTALSLFTSAMKASPDWVCIRYFDAALSFAAVERFSSSLASLLIQKGFSKGDRLALYMQNIPQFVIGLLAAWKAGGIAVPINPMNRERELSLQFTDCQPRALICEDMLYADVVQQLNVPLPPIIFTTSPLDFQSENDPRVFSRISRIDTGLDLLTALKNASTGALPEIDLAPTDTAFLVYTSGTTGLPKGTMNTHGAVAYNAQAFRDWTKLPSGSPILGVAPLFHISGLVAHIAFAFLNVSPLILTYRFDAGLILDTIERFRPGFTLGAITVFIALLNHPEADAGQLSSLTTIYSGGAPVPLSVVEQFQSKFGHYIHNAYGLTESTAPTFMVPLGQQAEIDRDSGAVSIGVPIYGVEATVINDDGAPAPCGVAGELVLKGPMIAPGYWNKPAESAQSMQPDGLHTGDIAIMNTEGWFFIVDRKKDMIISSGYKVWPREVEDVLYTHPSVREAAVVPAQDKYRGETVKAVISLKPGTTATTDELIDFCRSRMAAYKYPRQIIFLDELPKTPSGKILRRELV